MWPRVGVRKWVSRLKQVVLPAPFGPISAWMVLRRLARFAEGADSLFGEQRDHAQEHLTGHDRIAERRMPPDRVDAHPFGDRFERMGVEIGMDHGREQQRVEYRLREAHPGRFLL